MDTLPVVTYITPAEKLGMQQYLINLSRELIDIGYYVEVEGTEHPRQLCQCAADIGLVYQDLLENLNITFA